MKIKIDIDMGGFDTLPAGIKKLLEDLGSAVKTQEPVTIKVDSIDIPDILDETSKQRRKMVQEINVPKLRFSEGYKDEILSELGKLRRDVSKLCKISEDTKYGD